MLQKERKERMGLMPDEDFEGDFLEVEENVQGISNAASKGVALIFCWGGPDFKPRTDDR
jgi:hypothetical protein